MRILIAIALLLCIPGAAIAQTAYEYKCGLLRGLFSGGGCQPSQPQIPIQQIPIQIQPVQPDPGTRDINLANIIQLLQLAKQNDLTIQDVIALVQLGRSGEIAGIQPVPQPSLDPGMLALIQALINRQGGGNIQLPQLPQQPQTPQIPIGGGALTTPSYRPLPNQVTSGRLQVAPIVRYRPAATVYPRR